ncbi:PD-(D/E)XK nuclease domain-containing protein [Methanospirillum hungatei]|uniref:PD-(D/E)XK nuclease domain-containing protein n=1 Tax=Methanospirillum hungatei TaxID=2203 RepID=UPI0026F148B5|nr:PD-(D/E)XK nuclease domain-containing protein [Methanospirillum hungatei]MCA1916223.1 PD-(D/E)XK nuclease domain-containing protein [Methanospirillum hungatei]
MLILVFILNWDQFRNLNLRSANGEFILGLLANLRNIYEIRSNPETWYGRADILMIPRKSHNYFAYIIEFKTTDTKTDTEKTAQDAIEQIQEKEYISAILNAGIKPDKIIKLAIILQGKKVVVEIEKFNTPGTV